MCVIQPTPGRRIYSATAHLVTTRVITEEIRDAVPAMAAASTATLYGPSIVTSLTVQPAMPVILVARVITLAAEAVPWSRTKTADAADATVSTTGTGINVYQ